MKVLWICNIPMPEIADYMGIKQTPIGGWIIGAANELRKNPNVDFYYAFPSTAITGIRSHAIDNITFYCFGVRKRLGIFNIQDDLNVAENDKKNIADMIKQIQPDILHIYGTELPHSRVAVECFNRPEHSVVNLQGILSTLAMHIQGQLPYRVYYGRTIGDLLAGSLASKKKRMLKRSKNEIATIKGVNHVIGRTDWDRACALRINNGVHYHYCPEIIRDSFYSAERWNYNACEKHRIFFSQSWSPFKGLYYMLEALKEIKLRYPDVTLYIAGINFRNMKHGLSRFRVSKYHKYLISLIDKYELQKNVHFLGPLPMEMYKKELLKSHIFVSASTIENESNAVSEAKILGVPVVASYVGGVTNRLVHGKSGYFYPEDEPYMLAYYVDMIFQKEDDITTISKNAIEEATLLHNKQNNSAILFNIYKDMLK